MPLTCLWICRRKKLYKSAKINSRRLGNMIISNRFLAFLLHFSKFSPFFCVDSLKGLPLTSFIGRTNTTFNTQKTSVTTMDYNILQSATKNFQESEIIGEGGFGCVYKAQLNDNLLVAIKKLDNKTQNSIKEFQVFFNTH